MFVKNTLDYYGGCNRFTIAVNVTNVNLDPLDYPQTLIYYIEIALTVVVRRIHPEPARSHQRGGAINTPLRSIARICLHCHFASSALLCPTRTNLQR